MKITSQNMANDLSTSCFQDINHRVSLAQATSKGLLGISGNTTMRGSLFVLKRNDRPLQLYRPQTLKLRKPSPEGKEDPMAKIGQWNSWGFSFTIGSNFTIGSKISQSHLWSLLDGQVHRCREPLFWARTCITPSWRLTIYRQLSKT